VLRTSRPGVPGCRSAAGMFRHDTGGTQCGGRTSGRDAGERCPQCRIWGHSTPPRPRRGPNDHPRRRSPGSKDHPGRDVLGARFPGGERSPGRTIIGRRSPACDVPGARCSWARFPQRRSITGVKRSPGARCPGRPTPWRRTIAGADDRQGGVGGVLLPDRDVPGARCLGRVIPLGRTITGRTITTGALHPWVRDSMGANHGRAHNHLVSTITGALSQPRDSPGG
jgi:hypothetical protein